jgi:hypothetical protein
MARRQDHRPATPDDPLSGDDRRFTIGLVVWIVLRDALWFVGFMSLYAIWVTHLAGWAAETPVEPEQSDAENRTQDTVASTGSTADALAEAEPS